MLKRLTYLTLMLFLARLGVPLRASRPMGASQASPPELGVTVQSAAYDPVKQELVMQFYNSSKHDVTAYNYSVRLDYADGTSRLEDWGTEFDLKPEFASYLFLAGATFDDRQHDPQTKDVTRVVVTVNLVVYDERTAEVVNQQAYNLLLMRRKAKAEASQRLNEILKRALSSEKPVQTALLELERLTAAHPPNTMPDADEAAIVQELHVAIEHLSHGIGPLPSGPLSSEQFQAYVKSHGERLAVIKLHAELRRIY